MKVQRGYRTELDPNAGQLDLLVRHAGAARFAWNWGLGMRQTLWRVCHSSQNSKSLHRALNALKGSDYPWLYETSKCAPQEALRDLDAAYRRFFACRKGKCPKHWNAGKPRGKKRCGYPRFKSRKRGLGSFRLTGSITIENGHVVLPRIWRVRLKEKGYLPVGRPSQITVSEQAGRWFVSVAVEEEIPEPTPREGPQVGLDLGLTTLATLSDGTVIENSKTLRKHLKRLAKVQKEVSRKQKGSQNRRKSCLKLARLHARIHNIRTDHIHKATTMLAKTKPAIVVESLNVAGLMRANGLSQADASWGEFLRQLNYKSAWYGCGLSKAPRFYPSSKMCSGCGHVKAELPLWVRIYRCEACGLVIDRELNAAQNLSHLPPVRREVTPGEIGPTLPSVSTGASPVVEPGSGSWNKTP
ncbi:MAG: RNA-guided endonuclease TnpB family protein [Halobacteria archaeon]